MVADRRGKSLWQVAAVAVAAVIVAILPPVTAVAQDTGGERIVFVWGNPEDTTPPPDSSWKQRLLSMNRDGSDIRTIIEWEEVVRQPDVSPDGTTLVYVHESDLWLADIDGTNRRRLTNAAADGRSYWQPRFSPDGTELAYTVSGGLGPGGVHVSRADRVEERLVAANGTNERGERFWFDWPSWSPDGSRIALSRNYDGPGYPAEDGGASLAVVNADGTDLHEVPGTREDFFGNVIEAPEWSPDGTEIAYLHTPPTVIADIVITAVDGSSRRTILEQGASMAVAGGLAWSPSSDELVYSTWLEGGREGEQSDLFAIAPDGTGKYRILDRQGVEASPAFVVAQAGGTASARSTEQACPEGQVPDSGFSDIGSSEHRAAIDCAAWWGVTAGRTETNYAPAGTVTRAQMASFIARAITESGGELPTPSKDHFGDDDGSVHEPSINALAEAGIVAGVGDGRYEPSRTVARDQMARFLAQALEYRSGELLAASADYFDDDAGDTHENAINKAAEAGVTGGNGAGYAPADAVGRDQMASFLVRLLDLLVAGGHATPPTD